MVKALVQVIIFTSACLRRPAQQLLMATVPVILVYGFAQRWFVRGITLSGFGGR